MTQVVANQRHGRAGFSLVDILTGIALTATISLVAVPNASEFLGEYQLISAANQVGFEIARARMQAIGENMFVRIRMLDGGGYVREYSTDNVTYTQDGVAGALPRGIAVTTGTNGPPTFNRSGIATTATTITVNNEQGYKAVQTNILGRVTISSPAPS